MNKRKLPIHVELWDYAEYGLRKPSTLMIEQITTIPIDSLDKYVGRIDSKEVLTQIWAAISIQFPILQSINV
jgi:mRNA-degrading endonuclease toxin of MazEF toxin-antitoxin module